MTKTQALIIDDEIDARRLVSLYLNRLFPEIEIVAEAGNTEDAEQLISQNPVDIIFLDIELSDGNSFDLLKKLTQPLPEVIFITAYEEYAIQAIRVAALDYILKPIVKAEFKTAVEKLLQRQRNKATNKSDVSKLSLPSRKGSEIVNVDEIVRCEADKSYTLIYFKNASRKIISRNLAQLERELLHRGFLRVHHKHLVKMEMVKSYSRGKGGGYIQLNDDQLIPVSVRKKPGLLEALGFKV